MPAGENVPWLAPFAGRLYFRGRTGLKTLAAALAAFAFASAAEMRSHEVAEIVTHGGDADGLRASLLRTRGVLLVRPVDPGRLSLVTLRRVGDDVLRQACEKAGAASVSVERK